MKEYISKIWNSKRTLYLRIKIFFERNTKVSKALLFVVVASVFFLLGYYYNATMVESGTGSRTTRTSTSDRKSSDQAATDDKASRLQIFVGEITEKNEAGIKAKDRKGLEKEFVISADRELKIEGKDTVTYDKLEIGAAVSVYSREVNGKFVMERIRLR